MTNTLTGIPVTVTTDDLFTHFTHTHTRRKENVRKVGMKTYKVNTREKRRRKEGGGRRVWVAENSGNDSLRILSRRSMSSNEMQFQPLSNILGLHLRIHLKGIHPKTDDIEMGEGMRG